MKTNVPHLDIAALVGPDDWACLAPEIRRRFAPDHGPVVYRGALTVRRSAIGRVPVHFLEPVGVEFRLVSPLLWVDGGPLRLHYS
jgi:hypothetical protein